MNYSDKFPSDIIDVLLLFSVSSSMFCLVIIDLDKQVS